MEAAEAIFEGKFDNVKDEDAHTDSDHTARSNKIKRAAVVSAAIPARLTVCLNLASTLLWWHC